MGIKITNSKVVIMYDQRMMDDFRELKKQYPGTLIQVVRIQDLLQSPGLFITMFNSFDDYLLKLWRNDWSSKKTFEYMKASFGDFRPRTRLVTPETDWIYKSIAKEM